MIERLFTSQLVDIYALSKQGVEHGKIAEIYDISHEEVSWIVESPTVQEFAERELRPEMAE